MWVVRVVHTIWEDICRQKSDQIHVINLYLMAFDCGPTSRGFNILKILGGCGGGSVGGCIGVCDCNCEIEKPLGCN